MQSVNNRWYIAYSQIATVFAVLLMALCAAGWTVPSFKPFAGVWALSYMTFAIALAQVAYYFFFYKSEVKHSSYWSATLILNMILTLNVINLIHSTGRLHSWYLILWLVIVLVSGMFGNYAVVSYCFLITLYFILATSEIPAKTSFDTFSTVGVFATYIAGALSYLFWRGRYTDSQSREVNKLSGALKSRQQLTETLIQSIVDGMIVINTEGKISVLNPAAAAMTGWPIEEASGIDVRAVVKLAKENGEEITPADNPFVQVLNEKKSSDHTLQVVGRNGKRLVVSVVISPVITPKTGEFVGAVAVIHDVSNSRAEEHRRADFISTASHEMRTPVAAIEGYLALALNDKVSKVDAHAREYLDKAHASTQNLGKLFQDLLTSAKAEDGRLVNHPEVIEMGEFIEQLTDSLKFSAEKKGLLTEFILGTSDKGNNAIGGGKVVKPLYYVFADPDRLREVITNLFDNAVKYTETGKISLGLTGNKDLVQIYVRDTGPGIPAEDVPHLFQKFYRVDSSATRTVGGTGLGLFICRKIIELYQGRIWVESGVGSGSTFYINLPRLSNDKANALQAAGKSQQTNAPVSISTH